MDATHKAIIHCDRQAERFAAYASHNRDKACAATMPRRIQYHALLFNLDSESAAQWRANAQELRRQSLSY